MKDFRKQKVWKKAHGLALEVYRVTEAFPKSEVFGLTGQIRRAGVSIPANVAEGCGRDMDADFGRFLPMPWVRQASWNSISCWLMIWGFFKRQLYEELRGKTTEVKQKLTSFIKKLKADR